MGRRAKVSPEFSVSAIGEREYPSSPAEFDVPPGKEKLLSGRKVEAWRKALERSDLPDNVKLAFWNTYIIEGGNTPNPKTGSVAGVTKETLADLNNRFPNKKLPGSVDQLKGRNSEERIIKIYKTYFNDILGRPAKETGYTNGIEMLGDMPPQLSCAVVDTLYQHGRSTGARIIQRAINDTVGNHSRDTVDVSKKMDAETVKVMTAVADKDYDGLLKNIGHERHRTAPAYSSRYALFAAPLKGEPEPTSESTVNVKPGISSPGRDYSNFKH